jgi:membrane fusion protein (multidrug efflux system)
MFVRYLLVFLALAALVGGIAWVKYGQIQKEMAMSAHGRPPAAVSAVEVEARPWQPRIEAVGNVQAVQGVTVNNQVAGQVQEILFESGDQVRAGQPLVRLDTEVDKADLAGLEAALDLAETKLRRNQRLLRERAVSQGDFDEVSAQRQQAQAGVEAKEALIRQKTIRAPFTGQLGIRQVNLGQYLEAGSAIVVLEALDPVYVDYALPERNLSELEVGQAVEVSVTAYPDEVFPGEVRAISPAVNRETRNIQVRALLANPKRRLRPGMFAKVETLLPGREAVLTLPRRAITFNTYGDSVFLIQEGTGDQEGTLVVQRRQVRSGAVRGDDIEIVDGLSNGDRVVLAGQVKLGNGAAVQVVPDAEVPAGRPAAPSAGASASRAPDGPDAPEADPVGAGDDD